MEEKRDQENTDKSPAKTIERDKKPKSKTKGRIIPSRYLQQAEKSVVHRRPSPAASPKGSATRPKILVTRNAGRSPREASGNKKLVSSTPATKSELQCTFGDSNLSCIAPAATLKSGAVPKVKVALGPAFNDASKAVNTLAKQKGVPRSLKPVQVMRTPSVVKKVSERDVQELDVLYSREVLLAYRLHLADEELEKSFQQNMKLFWALSRKNKSLMEKHTLLVKEEQRKTHLLDTHKRIQQQDILKESLPDFVSTQEKICSITSALDSQQSQIPVKNIIFPQDKENFTSVMEGLCATIGKTLDSNKPLQSELESLTTANVRGTLDAAQDAVNSCKVLAEKVEALAKEEQSVLIQRYQETNIHKAEIPLSSSEDS